MQTLHRETRHAGLHAERLSEAGFQWYNPELFFFVMFANTVPRFSLCAEEAVTVNPAGSDYGVTVVVDANTILNLIHGDLQKVIDATLHLDAQHAGHRVAISSVCSLVHFELLKSGAGRPQLLANRCKSLH